jgi:tetratricopeptide (TPR) repeat protein
MACRPCHPGQRLPIAVIVVGLALHTPAAFAQIDPRTALLETAGWDALSAGEARTAAGHFGAALVGDPRNARLHLGAALAAYLEKRDDDAGASAGRALALDPRLTAARALLGRVQHRRGDVAAAIATLEVVVGAAPDDHAARAMLARWRRELQLHDRMQHAVGTHFTVAFEGPREEALATAALASLDRAYWRVGEVLGVFPNEAVPVVLYTAEQFRDITRSPSWAAAAYDGTIRVPMRGALEQGGELDRVLAHEFTHALIRTLAPRGVPTWLNEGLASALEDDDLRWARQRVNNQAAPITLRALQAGFGGLNGAEAEVAYAISALTVRRLLDEAGAAAVVNLLRDLGEGVDFDAAFLHRIQRPFTNWIME